MKKVLFVCTGNTCRSPMAEGIFRSIAEDYGLNVSCASVGISAIEGRPAAPNAVEACKSMGVDIALHRSSRITEEKINSTDYYIVMEQWHADCLFLMGISEHKVFLLGDGIPDPYGGGVEIYQNCCELIKKELIVLAKNLNLD